MVERVKVDLSHLGVIARRLVGIHGLTVAEVRDPKKTLRQLKALPSLRKVKFLAQGREQWGVDYSDEYAAFLKNHKVQLAHDYPRDRAWWPTALSVLVGECDAKLDDNHPWLGWFEAILGEPYPEFPAEMDWKALIHQVWLDRTRQWRFEWEAGFCNIYPDAERLEVLTVGRGGGNVWGEWRMLSYLKGFCTVEGVWEEQAFERLDWGQGMDEALAALKVATC